MNLIEAALLCALSSACAGELSNPERFLDGGTTAERCVSGIDVEVDILAATTCSSASCHDAEQPAAALDLQSPGLGARLMGAPSQGCSDRLLIDSTDIEASYFLESLLPSPACGSQMPIGGQPLSDEEIDCVRLWVESL